MDVYEKMNKVFLSTSPEDYGSSLIDFVDAAMQEKNRQTVMKRFYDVLYTNTLSDYVFDAIITDDTNPYCVYEGDEATKKYIGLAIPKYSTPVKTFKEIKAFGKRLCSNFTAPVGNLITRVELQSVLDYLEKEFSFVTKVFNTDRKPAFLLLDYSNSSLDYECVLTFEDDYILSHGFFMYHTLTPESSPITILFNVMGYALHARLAGVMNCVPDFVWDYLEQTCFPNIKKLPLVEKRKLFIETLSIGMMLGSPFDVSGLSLMSLPHRYAMRQLVLRLLSII